jgi:hypothetical protein
VAEAERSRLDAALLGRLKALDTVRSVARASAVPPATTGGYMAAMRIDGSVVARVHLAVYWVDSEFFKTLGVRVIRGTGVSGDVPSNGLVVDEAFAHRFWPDRNPVGQRFWLGGEFQVVGVTNHVRLDRDRSGGNQELYVAYRALSPTSAPLRFLVRLSGAGATRRLRDAAVSVAPAAVVRIGMVDDQYAALQQRTRLAASTGGALAILAGVVALIGVYGLTVFMVQTRHGEIAVRMVVGASRVGVAWLILKTTLRGVMVGVAVGLAMAVVIGTVARASVFGLMPLGAPACALTAAAVVLGASAASALAALKAASLDPISALRHN